MAPESNTNSVGCPRGAVTLIVTLPLPDSMLGPNGTRNRMARHRLTKAARTAAMYATLSVLGGAKIPAGAAVELSGTYVLAPGHRGTGYAPTDDDNAAAALKAYRDGIADALGRDDRAFRQGATTILRGPEATGRPRVEIAISLPEFGSLPELGESAPDSNSPFLSGPQERGAA